MNKSELEGLLGQLHERLKGADSIDADDRHRLTMALHDIETVLGRRETPAPNAGGLEALAVKFEVGHPALADGLRQLADLLGKAGI